MTAVIATKPNGMRVCFGIYGSEREADHICARLLELGIDATLERTRPGALCVGMTVRTRCDPDPEAA